MSLLTSQTSFNFRKLFIYLAAFAVIGTAVLVFFSRASTVEYTPKLDISVDLNSGHSDSKGKYYQVVGRGVSVLIRSSLTGVNSSDVTDAERSLTCTTKSSGTGEFAGGLPAVLPMTATSGFSFMRYEYNRTGNNSLKASKAGDLAVIITCTNAKFGLSSSKQIDFIFINPIAVDLQVNGAPTLGGDQTIKLAQNGELKISWQAKYSNSCESNYGKTVDGRNQLEKNLLHSVVQLI